MGYCPVYIVSPVGYPRENLYPVTRKFGTMPHPVTGEMRFHNGIDLGASAGTPVRAAMGGTVHDTWEDQRGGKQILIKHPNGWTTGYAHLSGIYVNPGDAVTEGYQIGAVGSTGMSTGPHLHFTMRGPDNKLIDPLSCYMNASVDYGNPYAPSGQDTGFLTKDRLKKGGLILGGIALITIIAIAASDENEKPRTKAKR